ncbi:MAG: shikimate kinase [Acidimicrobiales bacterium]
MSRPRRALLIGMMGSGKSTTAELVGKSLGWPCFDSDGEVERRRGATVAELWSEQGEAAFRREEAAVVADLLSGPEPAVVALGGGAVLDPASAAAIRDGGTVVWLRGTCAELAQRVGDGGTRPLLAGGDPEGALAELSARREGAYASTAHAVVDVDGLTPEEVAARVVRELSGA